MSTIEELDAACAQAINDTADEDTETRHGTADDLLVELLKKLGCTKTVAAYESFNKWYA